MPRLQTTLRWQTNPRILAIGLAVLALITVIVLHSLHSMYTSNFTTPPAIGQLCIFGDSLSDMGRVYQITSKQFPPNPPYFQGRYSNGRVWVEYLGDRLHLTVDPADNFAWGGATSGNESQNLVPGLLAQVQSFTRTQSRLNASGLYVLWAGANDYLQGTQAAERPVSNLTQAMTILAKAGATRFLVANLPDLGNLPATRSSANATRLTALTQAHNQELRRSLKLFNQQQPQLQIVLLDAYSLYRQAIASPVRFGFSNVTSECLSGSRVCSNPGQFLFWDGIHPTTDTHRILGESAFTAVRQAGMGERAALLLP